MRAQLVFLKTFLSHPTQVGAVAPSSTGLVQMMVEGIDWGSARGVVEYGPGTGVFTEAILERLNPGARFFAIERSGEMARVTRSRCPQADVVEGSVVDVAKLCAEREIEQVDAIVCGLPWAAFSESLQSQILSAMFQVLRPGGQFATFAYWQGLALPAGRRFARRLSDEFSSVKKSPTVWKNIPPAFVYRCVR